MYRDRFQTATGQFPLYAPFVEHALANLRPGGSLTAILPSKALTVGNAGPLRSLLSDYSCGPIALLPEATFSEMVIPILLTVERKQSDFEYDWWIEPILPYGPTPLLERLEIDNISQAADTYRDRLTDMKTRLTGSLSCQSSDDNADDVQTAANQTELDTFL